MAIESPISFELNLDFVQKVSDNFERASNSLQTEILSTLQRISNVLASDIGENKLSGQVLGNKTGNLRRGVIQSADTDVQGDMLIGIVGIPQEAWYGALFEDGPTTVTVGQRSNMFGTGRSTQSYQMTFPEKMFLRPELIEKRDFIFESLESAIGRAIVEAR